jgi:NADPH:quinone reductase-like Zn-dependent oxidoreductase
MKAARIHRFGGPNVISIEDVARPTPAAGEVLVRVVASGVGPWDAIIREGKSKVSPQPPLTLGSDISGTVEQSGPDVKGFNNGDEVFGVTNPQFCGANAEYAVASAGMIAPKPKCLSHAEAASVPVVAVTAWQMLFDYGKADYGNAQRNQTVLILGAAGNAGAYAVQLAARAGLHVTALVKAEDVDYVRSLGAATVIDYQSQRFEDSVNSVDLVLDLVGGDTRDRASRVLKTGGTLVSVVSPDPVSTRSDVHSVFFYVEVTAERLNRISALFNLKELAPHVGTVLPLREIRIAHEMLGGTPHKRGKIVLESAA